MTFYLLRWLSLSVFGGAISLYLAFCALLVIWQTRIIFKPTTTIETTPEMIGLHYEEVWLTVQDQPTLEKIHGWWLPQPSKTEKVLLYLHGNGENIGANLHHAHRFHRLGYSVLLIDYRGYGQSQGDFPTEEQVYEDAQVAWKYLVRERNIKPETIYLYGHSLGGAIAIETATRHPEAAGLMVESSFTSMHDMATYTGKYRLFPVQWLVHQRFDSLQKIAQLEMPVLLIHGTEDQVIPYQMSQRLYEAAKEPKKLFIVTGADHNNVAYTSGENYLKTVREFEKLVNQNHLQNTSIR